MPKFTLLSVRLLFITVLLTIFSTVKAQIPPSEARLIQPIKTETVAEIMERQRLAPPQKIRLHPEMEGPDRSHLKQNPLAPKTAGFPATAGFTAPAPTNLTPGLTFNGVTGPTETGAFPPDDMGAVGPTQYFVFVNGRLRTFNKTTGVADGVINADPDVFFTSVMTPPVATNFTSDPRVRYDRISARWLLIIIDVPGGNGDIANRCLLAVSNTSTITAGTTWTFTQFLGAAGKFFDYPTLGMDKNAIYIGGNMFSTTTSNFVGTNGYVINRTNLMANVAYTVYTFSDLATAVGAGPYTPQGVDNFDAAPTEGYFVGVDNATFSTLMIRRVSTPAAVPTISANISLTVPTTAYPLTVPHLGNTGGTNGNLDALDDRLYAAMMRNGSLWTAHNISVNTAGVGTGTGTIRRNGVRWYELQNLGTVPTLNQSGTIFDPAATAATARWYSIPSIMVSGQGHAILGMTTAGVERSNAAAATRFSSDGLGTTQAAILLTASSTAYNPPGDPGSASGRRWGDYSYVSLDPLDDMTMWCINQYCVGTNVYGCNVTKLFAPLPATPASCSPLSIASGQASVNVVLTGISVSGAGFYDPGPNMAAPSLPFNHIAATVTGGVTVNSITYTNPTTITLNLNTTAASAGLQSVTVTNPDGQTKTSAEGILLITGAPASTSDLAITKTDGTSVYNPGGSTTYTIVVSNAGPNTSTGATVTDNFPAAITSAAWTAVYAGGATGPANGAGNINATVNLPVGGTATFTAVCNISAGASGNLVNTATVAVPAGDTDPTPGNNSATDTDTQISADLSITKTDGVTTYTPGGSITYTLVASNAGGNNATGATVTDNFPAAITAVTWTAVYAGGASGPANGAGNISATVNIPVGGTATFTAVCTISGAASGNLVNTATIAPPAGYLDPNPANNSATDTDSQISADAAITKTDGVTIYLPGGSTTYTIVASNAGPNNITGGTVTDNFPAAITAVTWTAVYAGGASGPANGAGNINATVNVPVGGTATFTAVCTISGAASGNLVNTATIAPPAGYLDPTPANNSATDTDSQISADAAITKTDGVTTYLPGGSTTYTIVASNAGPNNITGGTVTDNFPAAITAVTWTAVYAGGASGPANGAGNINATVNIPVGGTATFTAVCTISGAASGNLVNTATIAPPAGYLDPNPANNSATDIDTQGGSGNVTVTATAGTPGPTPYATVKLAFDAINAGTHQGAIVVNVNANTDEGATPAVLNSSGNGAALYTSVIIRPTADGLSVVGSSTPGSRGVIELNGADNVTIDGDNPNTAGINRNLTLSLTSTNASVLVWLKTPTAADGCLNNTIKNCNLFGQGTYTSIAGVIAGSTTFGGAALAPNSNNTMQNNAVVRVQNGLFQNGFGTTPYDVNWQVKDNIMGSSLLADKLGFRGLILINASGYLVNNNTIAGINSSPTTTSTMTGIQLNSGNLNGTISNNKISDIKQNNTGGWGSNGIWLDGGIAASNTNVYNNMISDVASFGFNGVAPTDNGYGIVISSGGGYNLYYNTILMNTNQTSATGLPAAINVTSGITTANTLNVRDNLIVNTQTAGTQRYAVYSGAAASVYADINYNDYWFTGPNLGNIGGTLSANLAAWQTGTGKDANSVSIAPVFVSATDLHLIANSNCGINGKAQSITVPPITTDIDADTRNVTTPDIGADEFNGNDPAATIAYTGTPYCTNGGTATVTQTGTAGGTYSAAPAGLSINAATGAVTLATSTPGAYVVTYSIASAGSCASFSTTAPITVNNCTVTCVEDFDAVVVPALPPGWTATVGATCVNTARWATVSTTSSSAPNSAFVNDPNCISDEYLDSRIIFVPATETQELVFRNSYNLEASTVTPTLGFDGMVLEISINGGAFVDIIIAGGSFVSGGYNRTISGGFSSPIANRNAWSGNSGGFITTAVNLPAAALGQNVVFRWRRASDSSVGAVGANIDNVYVIASATISYTGSPYCSNAGIATVTRTGAAGGTYSSTAGLIINAANGDINLGTSTPGTYTVTYTIAAGGGCPSFITTTSITINALAAATISYAGSPYCSNAGTATVTRTGTAGGTYTAAPAGLSLNAATGDVTLGTSTPGTYTVTYTIAAAGGCPAVTATTNITITQLPAATISYAGTPYCSNAGTATVTRNGTAGGTYTAAPAGLSLNAATGDVTLGTSTAGTYTVSYTVAAGGGCPAVTATTSITITQLPAATISYAGTPYCSNAGTATVTRTGTAGGTYTAAPAGLSLNAANGDVTLGTSTPGTYTVTYTIAASGGCPAVTATTNITITQLPAATISYAGTPYCSNAGTATVTRTGTAGGTYSSTAGLTINALTGAVTLGTSTPGTYTVTYTIAAGSGCPAVVAATSITITQLPAATIAYAGSPYCSNAGTATVTQTGTAGGTYSSTAGLTINAATGAVTLGTSTAGTYVVSYTIAAAGGCPAVVATTSITITALPVATIAYSGSPYCSTDLTATVTRTGTAGGTYSSAPAGLTINAATGTVTPNTSTPGTYMVTYTVAAGGGCPAFSTTTTITINQAPNATIFYAATPYCSSAGTATVSQFGTTGGTYSAAPAGLIINAATGAVTLGTSTPGTYTVTYTIAASGGCGITITTTTITITAAPAATIAYAGSPYCSNAGTANVTRTGTPGGTYSSTAGLTINAATGAVTLGTSTPGTYTVIYTVAGGGGCATFTTTTTITITALPVATISYAGSPYCSNAGTATVTLTGTAGGTYTANPAGLVINAATGDVNLGISTAGTYTVTYTIAAGGGCPAVTATTTITITTLPAATISYAGNPYCQNAGTANVTRTGTAGGAYSASPAGLTINAATGAVTLGTSTPGSYTVTYTIAAGGGCGVVTATTSITVNSLSTDPTGATASATSICGPGAVTLSVTGGSLGTGANWRWYSGSCGGTLVGTGATLNLTVNATTTYFVRAEGTCNTSTCASVTVTVNTQPTISITASATTLQPGQTATLTATVTPTTGNTIIWYRDGVIVPGASGLTLVVGVDGIMGTYTARATTGAGCTALSNAVTITATSSDRMWITPNPNNGQFKVRYYSSAQQFGFRRIVRIYNMLGQVAFQEAYTITAAYSSMNIDARRLPKGIYIVMLTDAFGKEVLATGKVVIQ